METLLLQLMGNWFEDRQLKELGGDEAEVKKTSTRVLNAQGVGAFNVLTFQTEHFDHPLQTFKGLESQARDAHNYLKHAADFEGRPMGPRARMRLAKLEAEAKRFADEQLDSEQAAKDNMRHLTSTQAATFVRHSDEEYTTNIGTRVMKDQHGVPVEPSALDVEFAVSCGFRPPVARGDTQASLGASLPPSGADLGATRGAGGAAAAGDMPITVYSQRLAEGAFPASEAATAARPFARSSAFTADMNDPTKAHADAVDKPDWSRQLGSSMAVAPGAGLAIGEVLGRLRATLAQRFGTLASGIDALADAMDTASQVAAGRTGAHSSTVGLNVLRDALKRIHCSLPERDLVAVFKFLDVDEGGFVDRAELIGGLSGSLDASLGVTSAPVHEAGGGLASTGAPQATQATAQDADARNRGGEDTRRIPGTALLQVLFHDGQEKLIRVRDPVGMAATDVPAMKARLRKEGHSNVHNVQLYHK